MRAQASPAQEAPEAAPGAVSLEWETAPCVTTYNLYLGASGSSFSYGYAGAVCALDVTGEATAQLPDPAPGQFVWFVVVGVRDGVEGGHGFDSAGVERPLTGVGLCGVVDSRPGPGCPL